MKARFLLLAGVLAATTLAPVASRATTFEIHAQDSVPGDPYVPRFDQRAPLVSAGTSIKWSNTDTLSHTVAAYWGGTFASADIAPFSSFTATYGGGTVLYRCLYYSTLDPRVDPPACSGMCGALHDTAADTSPPTVAITTADGFVFTGSVRIDGTASDIGGAVSNVRVKIRPIAEVPLVLLAVSGLSEDASTLNPCIGCYGPSALWTFRSTPAVNTHAPVLVLPPGQYRVEATAVDPHGNTRDAIPITIYVVK